MERTDYIEKYRIIPFFYNENADTCKKMKVCYQGSLWVFEFANRGDQALKNFKIALKYRDENSLKMK